MLDILSLLFNTTTTTATTFVSCTIDAHKIFSIELENRKNKSPNKTINLVLLV